MCRNIQEKMTPRIHRERERERERERREREAYQKALRITNIGDSL